MMDLVDFNPVDSGSVLKDITGSALYRFGKRELGVHTVREKYIVVQN